MSILTSNPSIDRLQRATSAIVDHALAFMFARHKRMMKRALAVLIMIGLSPMNGHCLEFLPTEPEWLAWPEYCRARYVVSAAGRDSAFGSRISADEVHRWQSQFGDGWYYLHHYCAGLAWTARGDRSTSRREKDAYYKMASRELIGYTHRTPSSSWLFPEAAARACLTVDKLGESDEAIQYCQLAISAQPKSPIGYTATATLHRRHGNLEEAKRILELGDSETEGHSAELLYFLGVTYLDLGMYEKAQEFARRAYSEGYPLPALRDRLRSLGYSIE